MKQLLLFTLLTVIFTSCKNQQEETTTMDNKDEKAVVEETPTLQSTLDERKKAWEDKAPEDKKKIYAEGIQSVVESGIIESAKQKGDKAPDFTLKNATGEAISLSDYLKKGPVVLTWYRGGWCPYCNMTLHRLQEELPNMKAAGASLIALTPEVPDKSMSTKEKHQLEFEVLSDVGNDIAREYGIVYKLTDAVAESYQKGFDLHGYNGDESDELPLSATYIIKQDGTIEYAFLDAEYRNRAEPSELVKILNEMK